MRVSLKKIANVAGVSEATASLALNNRPGVNVETREKIREIAKKLGYVPSVNAQNLASRKSGLVGLIVPNIANVAYSTFVRGVEGELRDRGYKMIMSASESNVDYERQMIEHFVSFRVEGAIIYPMIRDNPAPEYLNLLAKNDIPMVFIGSYYRGVKASHVMSDIYGAIANAAEYLYERGGRNFCYFGGCRTIVSNELKIRALKDVLAGKGGVFEDNRYIELTDSSYDNAHETAREFFSRRRDIDSVLAPDAYTSLAVYNAIIENGFRVPEDISLVSFDNLVPPGTCKIELTCIEQNIGEIVKGTVDELFNKIHGNKVDRNILVETRLIARQTTR